LFFLLFQTAFKETFQYSIIPEKDVEKSQIVTCLENLRFIFVGYRV